VATPITMPQLGETVVEGTITKWLKKQGEQVERDEPLFEISTDKVDTEVPSPVAGTLVEIKVEEGETVQVGTELAMIETDGQAAPAKPKEEEAEQSPPEPAPKAEEEPEEAERAEKEAEAEEKEKEAKQPSEAEPAAAPAQEERGRGPAEETEAAAPARTGAQAPAGDGPRSQILSPLVPRRGEPDRPVAGGRNRDGRAHHQEGRDGLPGVPGGH